MTMNTMKTLMFAAATALSLGVGTAAMAQEGGNATVSGSTYFGPQTQSGSSDVTGRAPAWTPGVVSDDLPIRNGY
jgi:hypothetical protein